MSKVSRTITDKMSDEEFLKNLALRNWVCIEATVQEYTGMLVRGAMKMGFDSLQSEEIAQSVWLTFFEVLPKFEGRSQIKTFLYGILVNKARELRKERIKMSQHDTIEDTVTELFDSAGNWARLPINPEEFVRASQTSDLIEKCLEKLPLTQRQAFILKEVESEESKTICNILDVSHTNLRVLISRAKNGLRTCLEKSYLAHKSKA